MSETLLRECEEETETSSTRTTTSSTTGQQTSHQTSGTVNKLFENRFLLTFLSGSLTANDDIDLEFNYTHHVTSCSASGTSATQTTATGSTSSTLAALLNNPIVASSLPPTPPGSACGSDSENVTKTRSKKLLQQNQNNLISIQPKNAINGTAVILTEEEKRTLIAEGNTNY